MKPLPRHSLASQTAAWLRTALADGIWKDVLPGERILCEQLNVSRPVLRNALASLERDGVLWREPNRPRRIRNPQAVISAPSRVIFLMGADEALMPRPDPRIAALREQLRQAGRETELRRHPGLETAAAKRLLADWKKHEPSETRWVLISVAERVQRWFSERQIPALVMGTAHPGVTLAACDTNHHAVSRHAVGQLLRTGHRRIALISVDRPRAGNLESEAGFFLECQTSRHSGIEPTVIRSRRDPDDLCRRLRRTLQSRRPPTALLLEHAPLALTTLGFLQSLGLQIPGNLSVICLDYEPFLDFIRPTLAHYRSQESSEARQLARLILAEAPARKPHWILPRFVPGASLAAPKV